MTTVFSILVLILVGCAPEADRMTNQLGSEVSATKDHKLIEEVIKIFTANPEKFHFVADWLTETKIVFVEQYDGVYVVKTFDITTGKVDTLYEESTIIVDVLVHPSGKSLLLHTTTDSSSAIVKIVSIEGVVLDEISVASSELAIEWNDLDPTLVLLTAFYQDWTFDVFLYNGGEEAFNLIPMEGPFPKWLGTETIVTIPNANYSIEGGDLFLYDRVTGKRQHSTLGQVVHFDTYKDSLLTVQIDEEKDALYTVSKRDGEIISSWTMPAVYDYDEWFIPEVSWVSDTTLILPSAVEGGQLDELLEPYKLVRVAEGQQEVLLEEVEVGPLRCSTGGEKCLSGYSKDRLIDIKTNEAMDWLLLE